MCAGTSWTLVASLNALPATLDAKVSAAFGKILHGELGRQVNVLEEKAALQQKMLKDVQLLIWVRK